MTTPSDTRTRAARLDPVVHGRLEQVERELLDLRRLLSRDDLVAPSEPFEALVLQIDDQRYLLPVDNVREVVAVVWPAEVPEAPAWVRGAFRYGTRLLAMIDLRHRLFGRPTPLTDELTLLIVEQPKWVGILTPLPVDVVRVDPTELLAPDPEIPQSPWILASLPHHQASGAHLLSMERLGREYVLGAPQD